MCALRKVATPFFLALLFFLTVTPAHLQSVTDNPDEQMQAKLTQIEERIKKIERDQQEVLVREEKILEELTRLRFMVRRS